MFLFCGFDVTWDGNVKPAVSTVLNETLDDADPAECPGANGSLDFLKSKRKVQ